MVQQPQNTGLQNCSSDDAHRSESARADAGGQLTVVCQIRRCLAGQTLEDQDGDLEGHSLKHEQPVELSQDRRDVVTSDVLDRL